ncbi:hypothetical protein QZH41_007903 [Actinostola sp. cb2023]|nr:hypothetical protein QZH41_007903 [Actinostola sp. cb2023]
MNSAKRYGVVDFQQLSRTQVLDEFDPLSSKECENGAQNVENSSLFLSVVDDKSLARHSAPGLLFGSQSDEDDSNDLGATGGISYFGSEDDILVGSEQREFERNLFDDDLQRTSKKELEQFKKARDDVDGDSTPVYPSLSLSNDFHTVARHRIVSVSGADKSGRLVIVFSVCRIPALHQIDHHQLLQYIKHTLDQYVESDYSIVYFHYGLSRKNKPSFSWLMQVYRELERNHKFAKKITYVNCLQELSEHVHLNQLDIPEEVQESLVITCPSVNCHHHHNYQLDIPEEVQESLVITCPFVNCHHHHNYQLDIPEEVQESLVITCPFVNCHHHHNYQLDIPEEVQEHDARVMIRYKPKSAASSVFHASLPEIPPTHNSSVSLYHGCYVKGKIEGKPAVMLIDSGCTNTLVHKKFLNHKKLTGNRITVLTATGERITVTLALLSFESEQGRHEEIVGVTDKLPVDCLLGRSSYGKTLAKQNILDQWEKNVPSDSSGNRSVEDEAFVLTRRQALEIAQQRADDLIDRENELSLKSLAKPDTKSEGLKEGDLAALFEDEVSVYRNVFNTS